LEGGSEQKPSETPITIDDQEIQRLKEITGVRVMICGIPGSGMSAAM
jgi:hypothetical protein